jgi:hypothetical protein
VQTLHENNELERQVKKPRSSVDSFSDSRYRFISLYKRDKLRNADETDARQPRLTKTGNIFAHHGECYCGYYCTS